MCVCVCVCVCVCAVMSELLPRLGQDGRKLFASNSSLVSVLEGHVTTITVPQYTDEEVAIVSVGPCHYTTSHALRYCLNP